MKRPIAAMITLALMFGQCKQKENAANSAYENDTAASAMEAVPVEATLNTEVSGDNRPDAQSFIKEFYKSYLVGLENGTADAVKKKYCTSGLIQKLNDREMDYDPFLNAQDFDESLLETLDVSAEGAQQEDYVVYYEDRYSHERIFISMSLAMADGRFKIKDVDTGR